jgi:hypothetical protein
MTDDRDNPAGPPPEPPAPPLEPPPQPAPPAAVAPARRKPWGWIVAAILALILIVLVILYYMGMFDGEQRREEVPWNSGYEAPAPPPSTGGPATGPGLPVPAPTPAPAPGGQVTAAWLHGGWGQDCPAVNDPVFVFQPGGRLVFAPDTGTWTLSGNIVTVTVNGRSRSSSMRWDYLGPDSARVTRLRTGDVYTVYRCP